jgi:hypothetical protein
LTKLLLVFEGEAQSFQTFVMTWMIGRPWTISFRYIRVGMHTLYLRRRSLLEATHVAVVNTEYRSRWSETLARILWLPLIGALDMAFAYPYKGAGKEVSFCKDCQDPKSQRRGNHYHMKRYAFDKSSVFV